MPTKRNGRLPVDRQTTKETSTQAEFTPERSLKKEQRCPAPAVAGGRHA